MLPTQETQETAVKEQPNVFEQGAQPAEQAAQPAQPAAQPAKTLETMQPQEIQQLMNNWGYDEIGENGQTLLQNTISQKYPGKTPETLTPEEWVEVAKGENGPGRHRGQRIPV